MTEEPLWLVTSQLQGRSREILRAQLVDNCVMGMAEKYEVGERLAFLFGYARHVARTAGG